MAWPVLGELAPPAAGATLTRHEWGYGGINRVPLLPGFRNERGYWRTDVPTQMVQTPLTPFVLAHAAAPNGGAAWASRACTWACTRPPCARWECSPSNSSPATARASASGRRVDARRRRHRAFLWDGEFRETLGARATAGGRPHASYAVYLAPAPGRPPAARRRAVVVTNADAAVTVDVASDGPAAGGLLVATPEDPEARPSAGRVTLPPLSAAVVMER